jgi:CMP-N,N'-diacetyllegionaminic acid synthase
MNIALLTGRGGAGSSFPGKNTYPILGRPLMFYPYLAAKHSRLIDDIYISTDGDDLKKVARDYSIKIIDRPPEFAFPDSQHNECIDHALSVLRQKKVPVEILVILMCNVGIQPEGKIDECIQALIDDPTLDTAVTVHEWGDHHPTRAKTLDADGLLVPILAMKERVTTTRQLLGATFYLDHQVWAFRVYDYRLPGSGHQPWWFMGNRVKGIPNEDLVLDIHTKADIRYTEMWLRSQGYDK